jgi:hypothetical protein
MSDSARLTQLRAKLAASLKYPGGPPMAGYAERVVKIREEIERLEADRG